MKILSFQKNRFNQVRLSGVLMLGIMFLLVVCANAYAAPAPAWPNPTLIGEGLGPGIGADWVIPDSDGSVYVAWSDQLSSSVMNANPKAKLMINKVGPDGTLMWPKAKEIMEYSYNYGGFLQPKLTSDNGIVFAWTDNRNKRKPDVYARKLDKEGNESWSAEGTPVYEGAGAQQIMNIIADDSGGVIIIWQDDERPGLFMQHMSEKGQKLWNPDGVSLYELLGINIDENWYINSGSVPTQLNIVSDGQGGFFVSWSDIKPLMMMPYYDPSKPIKQDGHFLVQRINTDGNKTWFSNQSIYVKDVYLDWMPGSLFAADNNSAILIWNIPNGPPVIYKEENGGTTGYSNPSQDYYAVKISSEGQLQWNSDKPIYSKQSAGVYDQSYAMFTFAGGGLVFIDQKSSLDIGMTPVYGPNGKVERMEKGQVSVAKGFNLIKLDSNGSKAWEKSFSSGNGSIIFENGMWGSNAKADLSDSIFLSIYGNIAYQQPSQGAIVKLNSLDGSIKWWSSNEDILRGATKSPNYYVNSVLDNKGGLYAIWRELDSLKDNQPVPPVINPYMDDMSKNPSKLYLQHIIEDESGWADVQKQDWVYSYINDLVQEKAVSGYSNNIFRPNSPITRAEFTKMAVSALDLTLKKQSSSVRIIDISNHWARSYIETAIANSIIKGYPNGTFKPDAKITRAEIAIILSRFVKTGDGNKQKFADVPDSFWANDAISTIKGADLVVGYGDNTFRPNNPATRAEAAKVISKLTK